MANHNKPSDISLTTPLTDALPPINPPQGGLAIITDATGTEAAINRMGENYGLISVDTLGEIDEDTDLPPGVSSVTHIDGKPIVFWQLAKEGYASNKRKPYCVPILRSNPHFQHIADTQFNVLNQLNNGDLIVCYTSFEMARAYHNKKRAVVDRRNQYMYEGGLKHRDGEDVSGERVSAGYQQGVTVGKDEETVYDRAMGVGGRGGL